MFIRADKLFASFLSLFQHRRGCIVYVIIWQYKCESLTSYTLHFSREVIVTSAVLTCEIAKVVLLLYGKTFDWILILVIVIVKHVLILSFVTCSMLYGFQVICALFFMAKDGTLKKVYNGWTLVAALTASGLPAAIYALQNSLLQISYRNLDSLTFSMLNQTKILFTAIFTFFILRYLSRFYHC